MMQRENNFRESLCGTNEQEAFTSLGKQLIESSLSLIYYYFVIWK